MHLIFLMSFTQCHVTYSHYYNKGLNQYNA